MNNHGPGAAVAAGLGVSFVLSGIALLLQELGLLTLHWSLVLPVVLTATGLVVMVTASPVLTELSADDAAPEVPDQTLPPESRD